MTTLLPICIIGWSEKQRCQICQSADLELRRFITQDYREKLARADGLN